MGGMLVLEFAYFGKDYVRTIIPIATSARYSAWGISWGEAQRQSIYSDPKYDDGYYPFGDPPVTGLGAARMSALLTYRSRDSFQSRFGRNIPDPSKRQSINDVQRSAIPSHGHWAVHNDGHKNARTPRSSRVNSTTDLPGDLNGSGSTSAAKELDSRSGSASPVAGLPVSPPKKRTPTYFNAQSYLRYQGEKFIKRFDANCYIAITRKLDTHDVSRNRTIEDPSSEEEANAALHAALALIEQPCVILGIQSDGLFTFAEQEELAEHIPNATLKTIDSSEGHDAFLLEFEQVNRHLLEFLNEKLPDIMQRTPQEDVAEKNGSFGITKSSMFGEAEAEVEDITNW
jgi:homoserine O-acetyltransferase/O-succinyltransferase